MQWFLFIDADDISPATAVPFVKPNSIVLDIGANIGHFSLKLAKLIFPNLQGIEIHAFEPNPWVFEILRDNQELNKAFNLHLHPLAIGSSNREADFSFGKRNSGAGRFTLNENPNVKVNVVSLDYFCETFLPGKRISFIKIDVEGFEPEVFMGGWQVIKTHKPVLFFELSPHWYKSRKIDFHLVLDNLRIIGYNLQLEMDGSLVSMDQTRDEVDRIYQTNVLATPTFK